MAQLSLKYYAIFVAFLFLFYSYFAVGVIPSRFFESVFLNNCKDAAYSRCSLCVLHPSLWLWLDRAARKILPPIWQQQQGPFPTPNERFLDSAPHIASMQPEVIFILRIQYIFSPQN